MRALVTLANDREPYRTGEKQLREVARLAGWEFFTAGDEVLSRDVVWNAKRFVMRQAFEAGSERVCWCDSDVIVYQPGLLAAILNQEGKPGIWSPGEIPVEMQFAAMRIRGDQYSNLPERAEAFHRKLCAELIPGRLGKHFHDWFSIWNVGPVTGTTLCDWWDHIAERLLGERVTWADGMSVAIAAEICGVPMRVCARHRDMRKGIEHLHHSGKNHLYSAKGEH